MSQFRCRPNQGHGISHAPTLGRVLFKGKQNADAEIEAVQRNIGEDGNGNQQNPDQLIIQLFSRLGFWIDNGLLPARSTSSFGK